MRKVNIIGIFIITTLWAGCKMRDDKMRSDVPVLKPVEQSVDKIKTQFRTVATPIPLETNKECVVGYITNIHATKDRIYIMDRDNFYLFDSDGKFLKILPKGKGPGEITRPMTFKVNKDKDEIIILDNGIWINLFTLDGTFKKRYQLKMSIRDVIRISDTKLLLHTGYSGNNQDHLLYIFDTQQEGITAKYISNEDLILKDFAITTYNNFSEYRDTMYYHSSNLQTIYKIDDLKPAPVFDIDFQNFMPPTSFVKKFTKTRKFLQESKEGGYIGAITYFDKFNKFSLLGVKHKKYNCGFIDNSQSDIFLTNTSELFNLPDIPSLTIPKCQSDSSLYFVIEQYELLKSIKQNQTKLPTWLEGVHLSTNDNPIILKLDILDI